MGSEVFTALRVDIIVAWIMTPCSPVSCTKLLDKFTVSTNIFAWRWKHKFYANLWWSCTWLHGVIFQKVASCNTFLSEEESSFYSHTVQRIIILLDVVGIFSDCGVCSWPWHWFALRKADHPFNKMVYSVSTQI